MEFKEELGKMVSRIGLENPVLEIDMTPTGRFGGFVISESFSGMSHIDRQNMLWDKLDKILDEKRRLKIVGLLTMTPAEVEDADSYD